MSEELSRSRTESDPYELEFEDTFDASSLDPGRWLPHYLPHWSTRERSAARYKVGGGRLRLLIEEDQAPWCPELDGEVRVSSLQTGLFAGPLGTTVGQHRFNPAAVVREEQRNVRLYTPRYGRIELREGARRPGVDGRSLADRLRGRARAVGRDLRLRDPRPRRAPRSGGRRNGRAPVRRPGHRR